MRINGQGAGLKVSLIFSSLSPCPPAIRGRWRSGPSVTSLLQPVSPVYLPATSGERSVGLAHSRLCQQQPVFLLFLLLPFFHRPEIVLVPLLYVSLMSYSFFSPLLSPSAPPPPPPPPLPFSSTSSIQSSLQSSSTSKEQFYCEGLLNRREAENNKNKQEAKTRVRTQK